MEDLIRFFIEVGRLKEIPRPGWLMRGVKEPETVADHAFRVLILSWVLGRRANLNVRRMFKITLVHSLSAVYIDYISPYAKLLETRSKKELLKKYPALVLRAPIDEKGKVAEQRFKEEKDAMDRLVKGMPEETAKEILYLWTDFQQKNSKEAKLVWALDRIENMIQALEYKDQISEDLLVPFLLQANEVTDDPEILNFADSVKEFFMFGMAKVENKKNAHLIKFISDLGKLKKIKRLGWIYGGAKEERTESVAAHSFRLVLMCWLLAGKRRFDLGNILKIALVHDLMIVHSGDITPFDNLVSGDLKKDKRILEVWPTGTKLDKEHRVVDRRMREKKALQKLIKNLPESLRDEITSLWFEYEEGFSKEGRFVRQVDRIEKLFQAIEYKVKGVYKPNIDPYWIQLKTLLDDPVLVDFMEEVDRGYYGKSGLVTKLVDKAGQA